MARKPKSGADEVLPRVKVSSARPKGSRGPAGLRVPVLAGDPLGAKEKGREPIWVTFVPTRPDGDDGPAKPDEAFVAAGPTSSRVAVVDYDASQDAVYEPVRPRQDGTGFVLGGGKVNLADFRFHQVNAWAIINRTLAQLEHPRLFGRPIPWASGQGRLLVLPHAGYGENAYYSRETGALHFLYFEGRQGTVFTCLSHDIVTHELGHAVLDGLKPHYNDVDSVEVAGFHEYFGDALALTSALSIAHELEDAVGWNVPETLPEVVGAIGEEFGFARGESPLRHAKTKRTLAELEGVFEEHDHSVLLTNVFYEMLAWLYPKKLREIRKRREGSNYKAGQLAVAALANAIAQTSRMMLRGLDYCPPVGFSYVDYARAVLRSDEVTYPGEKEAREQLIAILVARGFDKKELGERSELRNKALKPYELGRLAATPESAYRFLDLRREALGIPNDANLQVLRLYRTRKTTATGYNAPREVVIEFMWTEEVALEGKDRFGSLSGTRMPLGCGGTLIFDECENVLHYVLKTRTKERETKLLDYVAYQVKEGNLGFAGQGLGASAHGRGMTAAVEGGRLTLRRVSALRGCHGHDRTTKGAR